MNTQLLGRARAFANGLSNTQGLGEEGVTGSIIFEERGQTHKIVSIDDSYGVTQPICTLGRRGAVRCIGSPIMVFLKSQSVCRELLMLNPAPRQKLMRLWASVSLTAAAVGVLDRKFKCCRYCVNWTDLSPTLLLITQRRLSINLDLH